MSRYLSDHVHLGDDLTSVVILDQTLLPNEAAYLTLREPEEMFEAIQALRVRGAPAIGICAGYCLAALAEQRKDLPPDQFRAELHRLSAYLNSSRPTAVNLSWALNRLGRLAHTMPEAAPAAVAAALREEAIAIHKEDIAMCRAISEHGLTLIKDGDGILTHCNAGPLATSQYGTALGPLLLGTERGMKFRVFADETRPLLQGARLTAYELDKAGVDVTLICDNMASIVMKNGWIDACFVGCDRVAANGDTANKIGTSGVAILAKHYGIPFYVLGPTSTIDLACPDGDHIQIELRDPEEIRSKFYARPMAPAGVKCYDPAFDVTSHDLIAGIVTEKGICRPPYGQSLAALFP
ncbi:MAG: S-methyl-5-thioribose-1-phosphate isomerase [Oscillospiraceae bacterium]|nr:S-methyl-5-thioribose-1-phosphate isomerase [Oscillospiraceae bacterium]MCI9549459.1 S-methyl-5-thioribose-1-phosphate isomerase [Oscillospiraceae bacterium]